VNERDFFCNSFIVGAFEMVLLTPDESFRKFDPIHPTTGYIAPPSFIKTFSEGRTIRFIVSMVNGLSLLSVLPSLQYKNLVLGCYITKE
jgi:hypothetical protein